MPSGTNAHELPMVQATLADSDEVLLQSPYSVLQSWQRTYDGNLLIVLPDTFGTTHFLRNAPEWISGWSGCRIDSKDPVEGGEELIRWWQERGQDPRGKTADLLGWPRRGQHRAGPTITSRAGSGWGLAGART